MAKYAGRTPESEYDQLMSVLDNVFFFEDREQPPRNFLDLLPKLYKKENNPCYNNFCVMEDGVIKGSVGLFPMEADAAGQYLKIGGIGNVAVARNARSEGHMITCMKLCLDQMMSDGTDFSLLGGQRQRYGFFGYEPAGICYSVDADSGNFYRTLGKDYAHPYTAKEITENDTALLDRIRSYYESFPYRHDYGEHNSAKFLDILRSWRETPYAAFEGEIFKGFFIMSRDGKNVSEVCPFDSEDLMKLVICVIDTVGDRSISFDIPEYDAKLVEVGAAQFNGISVRNSEMINILCYENFIRGFLKVKATYTKLCDGKLSMLIHGYRCDERLLIKVENNVVSVEKTESKLEKPDIEIEHREAIRLLTALFSEARLSLPAFANQWFPLPFFCASHNGV